jgi:hypothetical protein
MANRGSKKKIPFTIKQVSLVARIIIYIGIVATAAMCLISAIYSINKVGLLNRNVNGEYLAEYSDYDTMLMFGNYFNSTELSEQIIKEPHEYLVFCIICYAKNAIQYVIASIILIAFALFLDFDNLKNPFTNKSIKIVNVLIGSTMAMFFVNLIVNFKINLTCPHFVDRINTYIFPAMYALITFSLLIFNYCLRTGKRFIEGVK